MAVFGFQICFTLIMASLLQKIMPIYSLGRWLMCSGSLVYYKQPSNDELKKLSGKYFEKPKNKRKGNKTYIEKEMTSFKIAKSLNIQLSSDKIRVIDSLQLRNYVDYEWLVNYTFFVVLIYIVTEVYYEVWTPRKDFNISLIWIALAVVFAVKNMFTILRVYIKSGGGEIYLSVVFAIFSFISSLLVLMINEDYLDFGLSKTVVENLNLKFDISGLKLILAFISSFHGLIFAFPALRMSQMYWDALKYSSGNFILNFFLHLNFCAPALIVILWIKPIVTDFLINPTTLTGDHVQLVTEGQFEVVRIALVVSMCLLRLLLIRPHLQAYLNIAFDKVEKIRHEAGKITNLELRSLVGRVYYYLGVVAMQYLSPIVVHLGLAFYLKTLGNYSWKALIDSNAPHHLSSFNMTSQNADDVTNRLTYDSSLSEMISSYDTEFRSLYASISPDLMRGIFSYAVFWCSANWFVATCLGLLHHSYLAK